MVTSAWKPRMQINLATTDEDCASEDRQYEIEFKANYDTCSKRVQRTKKTIIPRHMYLLLWERCNNAMKNKIEARLDYIKIKNNPITLRIAIHEQALKYQET